MKIIGARHGIPPYKLWVRETQRYVCETAQATSIVLGYAIQLYGKTQLQDIEKKSISNQTGNFLSDNLASIML